MIEHEDCELFNREDSSDSGNNFQDMTFFTIDKFQNDFDKNMDMEKDEINMKASIDECNLNDVCFESHILFHRNKWKMIT